MPILVVDIMGQLRCMGLNVNLWHVPPGLLFAIRPNSDLYHDRDQYRRKSGAGWAVFGERNMFIGCTAQENGGHGWVVGFKDNQFMNCLGEPRVSRIHLFLRELHALMKQLIGILDEMLLEHA